MLFKDFEKTDRWIVASSAVVFVFSLLLILDDSWLIALHSQDTADLTPIGKVAESENDVRRRYKIAFSWLPLSKRDQVFQGDSIFTGDDSTAVIRTERGEEISIAANSLVVISAKENSLLLNIDYGSVRGRVDKDKKLLIASEDGITEFSGDQALVNVDVTQGKSLVVNVLEGQVQLTSDDKSATLSKDQAAEIGADGEIKNPREVPILPLTPFADKKLVGEKDEDIQFTWKSEVDFPEYEIEISETEDFSQPILKQKVMQNQFKPEELPKNKPLYWRVKAKNEDLNGSSPVSRFLIVNNVAPEPVFPSSGIQIVSSESEKWDVTLYWKSAFPSKEWIVEVSTEKAFTDPKRYTVSNTQFVLSRPRSADYYWRVRSADFEDAKWSRVFDFKVRKVGPEDLEAPRWSLMESPFQLETSKSLIQPRSFPRMNWSRVDHAGFYELEISKSSSFTSSTVKSKLRGTSYTWENPTPGKFFARVRAGYLDRQGPFSKPFEFEVKVQPPVSKTRAEITEEVPEFSLMDAPPPPFEIKWTPTAFTKFYELQFGESPDFEKALSVLVAGEEKKIQPQKSGTFYWRVRSLDENNAAISDFSAAHPITFSRVYRNPEKVSELKALYPKQQQSIVFVGNGKDRIQFRWTRPFNKVLYRVQISNDVSFDKVLIERTSENNWLLVEENLPEGWIFWRIRAENKHITTPWTGANRFELMYQQKGYDLDAPVPPQASGLEPPRAPVTVRRPAKAPVIVHKVPKPTGLSVASPYLLEFEVPEDKALNLTGESFDFHFKTLTQWPEFSWEAPSEAAFYIFEIALDEKFERKILSRQLQENRFTWKTPQPGRYFWRVASQDKKGRESEYTSAQKIEIYLNPPQPESPDSFVEHLPDSRYNVSEPAPFTIEWSALPFARAYELQFSKDLEFKEVKKIKASYNQQKLKVSKTGVYYWRVRALDSFGHPLTEFSPLRSVEIARSYREPASIDKLQNIFPSPDKILVYVGEGSMKTRFSWASPFKGGSYILQISKSADFKKPLYNIETKRLDQLITEDLPEGEFFWRVGYVGSETKVWSEPTGFSVKKETAFESTLPESPDPQSQKQDSGKEP